MRIWNVHINIRLQTVHPEVVSLVAKCHALASVIGNIPITPSRQRKIDWLNILRAVRGTTGIEGAELTEEEVSRIMAAPPSRPVLPPSRRREEQEARNAEKLMNYVARLLRRTPGCTLTEELVRKLHEITTKKIDYENNIPGKYRNFAVRAGNYIPPREGNQVQELMRQFISWFNQGESTSWAPIIRAIIAHFYIVSIHPFGEGNGRTSRAAESFLLYKRQFLFPNY